MFVSAPSVHLLVNCCDKNTLDRNNWKYLLRTHDLYFHFYSREVENISQAQHMHNTITYRNLVFFFFFRVFFDITLMSRKRFSRIRTQFSYLLRLLCYRVNESTNGTQKILYEVEIITQIKIAFS